MGKRAAAITIVAVVLGLWGGVAVAWPPPSGSGGPTPPLVPSGAFGTVTSVNGTATPGTCGMGTTGYFAVESFNGTTPYTVNVGSFTSSFIEPGQSSPSFTDVCVGELVGALGTVSGTTVQATKVFIAPARTTPPAHGVFGTVTTVNGTATPGTCGIGTSGSFELATWQNTTTYTVEVGSFTSSYVERDLRSASFGGVCVGGLVGALGTVSGTTVQATKVFIAPTPAIPSGAFGTVGSVNGTATPGTCGMGTTGSFDVTGFKSSTTYTVEVGSFTASYVEPGQSSPSFTDVCVGGLVGALGIVSGTTVQATKVFIAPARTTPPRHGVFGTVTSVNGTATSGTCGTGISGSFDLATWLNTTTYTVDVGSFTSSYAERGQSSASFGDVCVGELVGALGTVSGTTVSATKVFIAPWRGGSFDHRSNGHRRHGS